VLAFVATERTVVLLTVTFVSRGAIVVVFGVGVVLLEGCGVAGTAKREPPEIREGMVSLSHGLDPLLRVENIGNHGGFG
jgi:hypothetical protein